MTFIQYWWRYFILTNTQFAGDQQWFEEVYAKAQGKTNNISWADLRPNPFLLEWLETVEPDTQNQSAVVVGCGLGDDAEELALYGYNVTAFDVSATAVDWCRQRFPDSKVNYTQADLLNLPKDWRFDFVVEINTIQAMPLGVRREAIGAIASLVAPAGTLLAVGRLAKSAEQQVKRPWPLTRSELHCFEESGLTEVRFKTFGDSEISALSLVRFQATYQRK
jgi:SAM-dependent methyltransferase